VVGGMSRSRVLVVDDEPQVVRGLEIMLRGAGYAVEAAKTRSDVLARVIASPPEVLVLGLVQADGRSVELCREVRRLSAVPILVLSEVSEEPQKLRALEAGADDFLRTPFGVDDLLARLRALLGVPREVEAIELLTIGELTIDLIEGRVTRGGQEVDLEPAEFALLRELALHQGRLVSDRQLLRALWGTASGHETSELRVLVAGIRAKLERDPTLPRYLITEPGVGYRLRDSGRRARQGVSR
jgi:two-component system, OmpR family, KDP operon response regulator KdpE